MKRKITTGMGSRMTLCINIHTILQFNEKNCAILLVGKLHQQLCTTQPQFRRNSIWTPNLRPNINSRSIVDPKIKQPLLSR